MTLTQIQYFLEVCQTMNFTKAASNLFVAQPSLSRQIQMLETELGVQLLVRSNRNVVLTDAGEVFKREFTKISGAIEVAIHKIQEAGTQKKEINIGLWPGLGVQVLSGLMENLNDYFEDYKIYANKYSPYNLNKGMELGTIDVAVGFRGCSMGNAGDCNCDIEKLPAYLVYSDKVFPDKHKPSFAEFSGKKLICVQDDMSEQIIRYQNEVVKKLGITPSECLKTENALTSLLYTEAADGFSVWYNPVPEGLRTVAIPKNIAGFSISVCWKKDNRLPLRQFFTDCYNYQGN